MQLRSDKDLGSGALTPPEQADFAFLYLPYDMPGLMGGLVSGSVGACDDNMKVCASVS